MVRNQCQALYLLVDKCMLTKHNNQIFMLYRISCLIVVGLFLGLGVVRAQQDPVYGQYIFNSTIINPAQAGVFGHSQWGVLYRNQWAGIDGAPITKSFFTNLRIAKNMGLALGVYQDEVGPINDVTLQADVSHQVRLNDRWNMSGGLRVIGSRITANLADLDNVQGGDPNFSENINSGFYLNMGMGMLVYDESSFFGLSIPKAIMREFEGQQILNAKMKQHMFAYGGTSIAFNELWTLSPSVMLRFVKDSPFQFDVNAVMNYKNTFDFGPMLRSLDVLGWLVGMRFNEQWYLGYQYEFPLQAIQQVTRQTHEISLRYLWDSKYKTRIRSPRYFI